MPKSIHLSSESHKELLLENREFSYLHDSFLLTNVEIMYPPGKVVVFRPPHPTELEGRRVGQRTIVELFVPADVLKYVAQFGC